MLGPLSFEAWDGLMVQDIWMPLIDSVKCTGCGDCITCCSVAALKEIEGTAVLIDPMACTYCADCEMVCPVGAIALPYQIVLAPDVSLAF
jgi:ferredoxin